MIEKFIKELTELSKKYNVYIKGCGCCSSPILQDKESKVLGGDLNYNEEREVHEYD